MSGRLPAGLVDARAVSPVRRPRSWRDWLACRGPVSCRWPTLVIVAAIFLLAVLTGCSTAEDPAAPVVDVGEQGYVAGDGSLTLLDPANREPAPELVGPTLDGDTFDLADHTGHVVVLNVWASWCAPCRAETPELREVWEETRDSGVQFVGLDTRDSDASAQNFVEAFGVTYPQVLDPDGRLQLGFADTLPPQAIPSTLIVDKSGRVAGRVIGVVSQSDLLGLIELLLEEEGPEPTVPIATVDLPEADG